MLGWQLDDIISDRLTNTRYADDMMIFGKSLEELEEMLMLLKEELAAIRLEMHESKTKIMTNDNEFGLDFIDIDGLMLRTRGRPIPQGKISALDALGFGVILAVVSVLVLGLAVNYFAAFLLFFSIFFYVFIYTIWLKRRTPQNIVIGGAAGAFPPVIGWACSTGDVSVFPLILFLIIFMWTPPHFWALALYKDIEYSKAKVPMLPVVKGKKTTKRQIMIYSTILFAVTILPFLFGFSGFLYLISALILNAYFCYLAFRLLKSCDDDKLLYAPKLFKFSILYLYSIFSFLVIDLAL